MNVVFKKLFVYFLFTISISDYLFSQNLLQKAETGFVKFYLTTAKSSTAFDFNGNLYPTASYSEITSNLYLKYGFSDNLTITANVPVNKSYTLGNLNSSGFGDPVIGFTVGLNPENPLLFVVSADMLLPIGDSGSFDNPIPVGWEEYQTQFRLQFQYSPPTSTFTFNGYGGGTWRGNNKNNELIFGFGTDWEILKSLKISSLVDNKIPIGKIRSTPPELNGAANGLTFSYFTTGLSYRLHSLLFSYFFRTEITAQNTSSAGLNSFGIGFLF